MMQTDTVFACFVEHGDFIVYRGEAWEVFQVLDIGDVLEVSVRNRDSDWEQEVLSLAPFDHVPVVVSFEEHFEFEDVDLD